MKTQQVKLLFSAICIMCLGLQLSCTPEDKEGGMGGLKLQIGVNTEDVTVETKAEAITIDSCKVQIKNSHGDIIRKYNATAMPVEEWLLAGRYAVEATLGTPKKAEFDHPCYAGSEEIDIEANKSISKEIVCKLIQSKVSVIYEKGITANFKDYSASVEMGTSKLEFKKDSTKVGYYYNSTEEEQSLICKVTATPNDGGSAVTKDIKIEKIQPCMHYAIHIDYNTEIAEGGFKFKIEVNEATTDKDDNVTVPITKYPSIDFVEESEVGFIFGQIPTSIRVEYITLIVKGYPKLGSVILSGDYLTKLGLPISLDLLALEESAKEELKNKEFTFSVETDDKDPFKHDRMTIGIPVSVRELFTDAMLYAKVIDSNRQCREHKGIKISVTDLHVSTVDLNDYETWSSWAVLRGAKNPGAVTIDDISFEYKKSGSVDWQTATAISGGNDAYYASITGLTAGAEYQYRIKEGEKSAAIKFFKTEGKLQLPNSGFEEWHRSDEVDLIYSELGTKFWDSGNHGSATMRVNVTTQDKEIKQSGASSIKLQSQFVGVGSLGKFAAGNLFAGAYLKTDGTDGILSFGRPFESRPHKMIFYYKYVSNVVDKYVKDPEMPKGSSDKAHIYIAMGDWDPVTFGEEQVPVLIKTKPSERQLFNPKDSHVIAYGELILDASTVGDHLIEGTVELSYFSERRPKYIVVVASASKYGDYFAGAEKSTLWLDDLFLEYPNSKPTIKPNN